MDGCNEINHIKEDFKFVALLKACAKKKNLCEGTKLHGDILKRRGLLEKSPYLACILIIMHSRQDNGTRKCILHEPMAQGKEICSIIGIDM